MTPSVADGAETDRLARAAARRRAGRRLALASVLVGAPVALTAWLVWQRYRPLSDDAAKEEVVRFLRETTSWKSLAIENLDDLRVTTWEKEKVLAGLTVVEGQSHRRPFGKVAIFRGPQGPSSVWIELDRYLLLGEAASLGIGPGSPLIESHRSDQIFRFEGSRERVVAVQLSSSVWSGSWDHVGVTRIRLYLK